jgi:predicted DNA-binding transcriptional regulator AlpA
MFDTSPLRPIPDNASADKLHLASDPAPVEVLLVDTAQAARMVGVSVATWHRLRSAGKTPAPLRLAGSVRYRLEDLKLWVSLGCCDRKSFEAHKVARNGRK